MGFNSDKNYSRSHGGNGGKKFNGKGRNSSGNSNDKNKRYSGGNKNYKGKPNGGYKSSGYKKNYKPIPKKPVIPPATLEDCKVAVCKCINDNVDKLTYFYKYNINDKKINDGILSLSLRMYKRNKDDRVEPKDRFVHIYFTQDISKKIHVLVTDGTLSSATVLYVNQSKNPIEKFEKYMPSIIKSLEKLLDEGR